MPLIQAQVGTSLADTYDVPGSVAGVEELLTREVPLSHEMGGTIASERMRDTFFVATSGNVLQSANFSAQLTNFINVPTRILGVAVVGDVASRLNNVAVMLRNSAGSEFPLLVFDDITDTERNIRFDLDGVGVASMISYQPNVVLTPTLLIRGGAANVMGTIILAGTTTAFGAGNLVVTMIVHTARPSRDTPAAGAADSFGLPFPSW